MFAGPARDDGGAPQRSDRSPHRDGKTPSTSSSGRPGPDDERPQCAPRRRERTVERRPCEVQATRRRTTASQPCGRSGSLERDHAVAAHGIPLGLRSRPSRTLTALDLARQSECNRADQGQRRRWPDPDRVRLLVKYGVEGQSNHRRTHDSDGRRSPCPGSAVAARQLEQDSRRPIGDCSQPSLTIAGRRASASPSRGCAPDAHLISVGWRTTNTCPSCGHPRAAPALLNCQV
jgi:hypothetical protein